MIIKKAISVIISATILLTSSLSVVSAHDVEEEVTMTPPEISAIASIVISADTGEVIYSKNADTKLPMASVTKMMSTLILLESGDLDTPFEVDSRAIGTEGSSMYLQEGDIVTKYALACGMLLPSGNDAANATAYLLAGSLEGFAVMMNKKARDLGMTRSYFVNPSGLEGDGHGSSAYDLAILARAALQNEIFRSICSQPTLAVTYGNPPTERYLKNTNRLLTRLEGTYGVKTGFTDEAGRCLVSAYENESGNFIAVTLKSSNDYNEHIQLYEYSSKSVQKEKFPLPSEFSMNLAGSSEEFLPIVPQSEIEFFTADKTFTNFTYKIKTSPFAYAPIKEGETVGEIEIIYNGKTSYRVPLIAAKSAEYMHFIDKK